MKQPPKEAIEWLRQRGHVVEGWTSKDDWWVGYSDSERLITVCVVTGKLLIEVCKRDEYVELLYPK